MKAKIIYRPARREDSTPVARLMVQAMGELAGKFVNSRDASDAIPVFEHFFRERNNLYSYENTLVGEDEHGIVGSITGYDGGRFLELRQPVMDYLKSHWAFHGEMEEETAGGEFYLDTVSVDPEKNRLGIGTELIRHMVRYASEKGHRRIGLLVDRNNHQALRLYEKLGFRKAGERKLLGVEYDHLVLEPTSW